MPKRTKGRKKGGLYPSRLYHTHNGSDQSGAAGTLGPAAGAAGTEIDSTVQLEAIHVKIHFDRLCFIQKFRIDDEFKSVDVKFGIRIGKLIQSHGQARTPSTAFVKEYADGLDLFPLEILGNLLNCRLCDLEHVTLLENKNRPGVAFGPPTR